MEGDAAPAIADDVASRFQALGSKTGRRSTWTTLRNSIMPWRTVARPTPSSNDIPPVPALPPMYSDHAARDIEAVPHALRPGSRCPSLEAQETLQAQHCIDMSNSTNLNLPSIQVHEPPRSLTPPEYLPAEGERASWI